MRILGSEKLGNMPKVVQLKDDRLGTQLWPDSKECFFHDAMLTTERKAGRDRQVASQSELLGDPNTTKCSIFNH